MVERKRPLPDGVSIQAYRFLDEGHIDSLGVMAFVLSIEERFGISLTDEDIVSEDFRSVGGLTQLIINKSNTREN